MTIAEKYKVEVSWRTIAKDVFQLTREGVNPATFRMTVKAIDSNNKGAGQKQIGFYLADYMGIPFSIIGTSTNTIDVQDDFRTGKCPTSGQNAIVFKSVFYGQSMFLAPENFQHLHPIALANSHKYDLALLYANDPNAKKVPFTTSERPSIINYQSDQVDPEDATKTINYADMYGDDPQVRVIITIDANNASQRQQMAQFTYVDGKLDTVYFDFFDDPQTGYLIISKG